MRLLESKVARNICLIVIALFVLPLFNYIIEALCGFGKIVGTCIRILATI